MSHVSLGSFFYAVGKSAEFRCARSTEIGDNYNPNPEFFQKAVDNGFNFDTATLYTLPATEIDLVIADSPWHDGFLIIQDGVAHIIDEDYEGYCTLKFNVPIQDEQHLTELLKQAFAFIEFGYKHGVKYGRAEKANEIARALRPE